MKRKGKLTKSELVLKKLARQSSFTLSEVRKCGLSQPMLLKLVKQDKVIRLRHGVYAVSGSEDVGEEADYRIAQHKFGRKAAIAGLTALFRYQLIDESPSKVWLLVPPGIRTSDRKYRLLRTSKDIRIGIEDHKTFRITSLERSLVDAIMFKAKIGEQTAKLAIIRALRKRLTTAEKIFRMADKLGCISRLEKEWPSIQAGLSQ